MPAHTLAYSFEGLPHLPPAVVARSRLLARALASWPDSCELVLRGLGRVTLRLEGTELVPWDDGLEHADPACSFALVRGGAVARLRFDRFLALGLVRAAFGGPAAVVLRPLGRSERGVLAALVAAALSALGTGISVELAAPARPEPDSVILHLLLRSAEVTGPLRCHVPLRWFEGAAGPPGEDAARGLELELAVELGRTTLARTAWATAEVGDAVLFSGASPAAEGAAWPCVLRIGARGAPGEIAPDGSTRCTGPFTPLAEAHMKDPLDQEDSAAEKTTAADGGPAGKPTAAAAGSTHEPDEGPGANPAGDVGDVAARTSIADAAWALAEAPVEVVAELGRLSVRGDEVLGLRRGSVLALGPRRSDLVSLRSGGREWARGELVTIDDQLGVRITELRRR